MPSPSPPNSVKVTYLKRRKQQQSPTVKDGNHSDSESERENTIPNSVKNGKAPTRTPDSTGAKKIDFKQPELPSKHKRADSQSVSSRKPKSTTHTRSSSSKSQTKLSEAIASSPSGKVPAREKTPEPETELDDDASVADSLMSASKFIRRTEQERIEYFRNQPECDLTCLEPHRIKCLRCGKFVSLGTRQTYTVKPWEKHRARCDQNVPQYLFGGGGQDNESDLGSVAPSIVKSGATIRRTEAERKAVLEADPRCAQVNPDQALCQRCQKWIRLSSREKYALYNWRKHQSLCSDAIPSSRVTAAERKLRLVNDNDACPGFTASSVQCARCDANVALEGDGDYNLTNWEMHKSRCPKAPPKASGEAGSSSPRKGKKRALEDAELPPDDPDTRESNRPRTENYVPPQKESASVFGWFLTPFKAFVSGFKDSLS